ncbi:MAG: capsule biosynthesis protein [Candidatus Methylumidiphilus sp.]
MLARSLGRLHSLVFYTVIIPTLLAGVYYGLFASDIYISESRLVVRTPRSQAPSAGISSLLHGAGIARAESDAYSVHDFILSRDALKTLNGQFHLDKAFGGVNVDLFRRFAGLDWWNNNFEGLYRYYTKQVVNVDVDSNSSILILNVRAFSAEDARRINERLVEMSEDLVNQLNQRSSEDLVRFAMADVEIAEKKAQAAVLAVAKYRGLRSVFDPEQQSPMQLQLVGKLQTDLIAAKAQLAEVTALTRDNPQIPSLQRQVRSLQESIEQETQKVTGGSQSLSGKAAEYDLVAFEREFAEKQLAAAMAALEGARNEVRRKIIYLERLVQPGLPDVAMEPKRLRNVFAVFVLGMITWGILTILVAGVREHHD